MVTLQCYCLKKGSEFRKAQILLVDYFCCGSFLRMVIADCLKAQMAPVSGSFLGMEIADCFKR